MTTALHDEFLREGPRDAGEPETADEISKVFGWLKALKEAMYD